jgi:eukaryotic-like serine/threonine-protein kinase
MNARQPTAEELFHACLALSDAAARQTYLAERTAADPALRARVEQLLAAAAAQPAGFLQARGGRGGAAPASESHGIGEAAGDLVDRYKLLQPIGEGGMGTVWMAEQREPVVRKVALKIVKLGMDTREVVVRFEAERR